MADDLDALDAYSAAVIRVADSVLPSVASLRVATRRGEGAGSASVLTGDGFLLTSAHVVQGADTVEAAFTDGNTVRVDVIGRDPLFDLAVLAIPINDTTREIISTLMARGRVRRAWRGIVGAHMPLPPALAAKTGRSSGLHVAQVMPQSPAAQSGLRVGDVVVAVAGEPIGSTTALQRAMVEDAIGRRLEITVWRNGALVDVIAVPRELTDA